MPRARGGVGAAVVAASGCSRCPGRGARRATGLVGLPRLEPGSARARRSPSTGPLVRPARLAARGHDPAERQVGPAALLEGRDARRLRRLALAALRERRRQPLRPRGRRSRSRSRGPLELQRVQPALGRAHPLHRPLAVEQPRRGRGHHLRRRRRGRRARPAPTARRGCGEASRSRRATRTPSAPTRPNPTQAQMRGRAGGLLARHARATRRSSSPTRARAPRRASGSRATRLASRPRCARDDVFVPLRGDPRAAGARAPRRAIRELALRAHVRARPAAHRQTSRPPTTRSRPSSATCRTTTRYRERVPTRPIPLRASCSRTSAATASSSPARWR